MLGTVSEPSCDPFGGSCQFSWVTTASPQTEKGQWRAQIPRDSAPQGTRGKETCLFCPTVVILGVRRTLYHSPWTVSGGITRSPCCDLWVDSNEVCNSLCHPLVRDLEKGTSL